MAETYVTNWTASSSEGASEPVEQVRQQFVLDVLAEFWHRPETTVITASNHVITDAYLMPL